jgi:hypothetical protein
VSVVYFRESINGHLTLEKDNGYESVPKTSQKTLAM